jgi:hypothetical protein
VINITKLQYPSPVSQYPSLNKLKGIKTNKTIPTLKKDHQIYEKEDEKANLFAEILKKTFSDRDGLLMISGFIN